MPGAGQERRAKHPGTSSGVLSVVASAAAHHSHGNYEDTFIDLRGTVTEVHLLNPHSWVYVDVRNTNGQVQQWALEATNKIGSGAHRRHCGHRQAG